MKHKKFLTLVTWQHFPLFTYDFILLGDVSLHIKQEDLSKVSPQSQKLEATEETQSLVYMRSVDICQEFEI